jgi:hypothetical protein
VSIDAKDVVRTLLVASPELVGLVLHGAELLRAHGESHEIEKLDAAIAIASSRNRSAEAAAELDADIKAKGG